MVENNKSIAYEEMSRNSEALVNKSIAFHKDVYPGFKTDNISDGYHTFGELYQHRIQLWIAYCHISLSAIMLAKISPAFRAKIDYKNETPWKTKYHSDGELAFGGGWFVLGIGKDPGKQKTYHLPDSYWEACKAIETIEKAPDFDGHSSEDVLKRLIEVYT